MEFNFKPVLKLAALSKYFSKDLKAKKSRKRKQVIRGWVHIGGPCAPRTFLHYLNDTDSQRHQMCHAS